MAEPYLDEDAIVDLAQSQQLEDLAALGVHVIDTPDAHHKGQLGLWLYIEASLCLCIPLQPDQVLLLQVVPLDTKKKPCPVTIVGAYPRQASHQVSNHSTCSGFVLTCKKINDNVKIKIAACSQKKAASRKSNGR